MSTMQTKTPPPVTAPGSEITELEQRFIESVDLAARRGGVTHEEVGKAIGINSKSQMSKRMNGTIKMSVREMHYAGKLFGVDPLVMAAGLGSWLNDIHPEQVRARLIEMTVHQS